MSEDMAKMQRLALAAPAFRPSAPVDRYAMLAGRRAKLLEIVGAVSQPGRHVALYGERGVGKTSIANILAEIFDNPDLPAFEWVRVNCSTEDSFTSLWRTIFRELEVEVEDELGPEDVRYRLGRLSTPAVVVIDELDRLEDDDALTLLADTIKTLSDHVVPSTLILVGVASSVDELVGEHASIERALVQVEMPRMSQDELHEIVEKGCTLVALNAAATAAAKIASLSEGLPHYTHLLGYHATQRAIQDDRGEIIVPDVDAAINQAVATHTIKSDYQRATRSTRAETLYPDVLLACALAQKDALGAFPAGGIRDPLKRITGTDYAIPAFAPHLKKFLQPERGSVLWRDGEPRRYFYRFSNPLMQPYVILYALAEGKIDDAVLNEVHGEPASDAAASKPETLF